MSSEMERVLKKMNDLWKLDTCSGCSCESVRHFVPFEEKPTNSLEVLILQAFLITDTHTINVLKSEQNSESLNVN